jgi:teichuronic acid biosynthesis glycosyltransferase TuaG
LNEMPKVSIIIPFYNCEYIHFAIRSALNQTYSNFEIIVVDDGSTQHQYKISPYKNRIIYIYKENGGTASALNKGIAAATGELIAWLSSDDMFLPNKLSAQVNFMKQHHGDIVYTNFNLINSGNQIIKNNVGLIINNRKDFINYIQSSCPINGSTVLIKKKVLELIGPFDESLKYTQDYEMWIRAVRHFNFCGLNKALLNYRVHENMGSKKYSLEQNKEIQFIQEKYSKILKKLI